MQAKRHKATVEIEVDGHKFCVGEKKNEQNLNKVAVGILHV